MIVDRYLKDKVKTQKLLKINQDGIKEYGKTRYVKCLTKQQNLIFVGSGKSANIVQTEKTAYILKDNIVKAGDLLEGKEITSVKPISGAGLVVAYVQ